MLKIKDEVPVKCHPWLEYVILLAVGIAGYEMKKPFGMMLHRIMGIQDVPPHSTLQWASNQAVQIAVVWMVAVLVHRHTRLPAAPWLERVLYGWHRGKRIRIWAPGFVGALACLVVGGALRFTAARFGVLPPLGTALSLSSLSAETARKLAFLYPWGAIGAALSEEVLYRFGILSILLWLVWEVLRKRQNLRALITWAAIIFQALLFGYVHVHEGMMQLPVGGTLLQVLIAPETWAGLVFGYVYASYGLEASMVSHASIDLIQLTGFVAVAFRHAH